MKFVHCCHGNRNRKDQTAKAVVFVMFWKFFFFLQRSVVINFVVYFSQMITKQGNEPEIASL